MKEWGTVCFFWWQKIHCWWWQWELKVSHPSVADLLQPMGKVLWRVQDAELRVSVCPSVHLHPRWTDQHHTVPASKIKDFTGFTGVLVSRICLWLYNFAQLFLKGKAEPRRSEHQGLSTSIFQPLFPHTKAPESHFLLPHSSMGAESACSTPGE